MSRPGRFKVTNVETGKSTTYKTGDFIIEMIGQWHQATNVGDGPVKLLVIDQVEEGRQEHGVAQVASIRSLKWNWRGASSGRFALSQWFGLSRQWARC